MSGSLGPGPDVPAILCRPPDGCCGPSPCVITEEEFACQVRQLLPEGDIWNPTLPTTMPETGQRAVGAAAVGCMRVGCEQLIFGSCCAEIAVPCDEYAIAPQLAIVDAFSAVAYKAVQQLCTMLKELDPCTAETTIKRWGERFGLVTDDPCAPKFSDKTISALICAMSEIKGHVITLPYLQELARRFGAVLTLYEAGNFNCGPGGWWTMARDSQPDCPVPETCPPGGYKTMAPIMRMESSCASRPLSLNVVTCPGDVVQPDNCNLPPPNKSGPHDPELYNAFKWLLPKILPQPAYYCIYECNPDDCIV